MKKATIYSVCECQARLGAELDEDRHVIRGWARDHRRERELAAPAHSIDADDDQFEVAWFCPFCIRNSLRSFDAAGLSYRTVADEPEPEAKAAS